MFYTDSSAAGVNLVATALSGIENLYVQNVAGTTTAGTKETVTLVFSAVTTAPGGTDTLTITIDGVATVVATGAAAPSAVAVASLVANKTFTNFDVVSIDGATVVLAAKTVGNITNPTVTVVDSGSTAAMAAPVVTVINGTAAVTTAVTQTVDATTLTDTVQFWNNASTGAVTFDNIQQAATIGVKGVTAGANATTTANFDADVTSGTADSVSIALDGNTSAGTITIGAGFETVNVSAAGKNTVAELLTGAKTVNITGAGDLTITATIADATKIDGSTATGKLTLTSAVAKVDIDTGTGADKVTVNTASEFSVNTGAGNDTVVLGHTQAAGLADSKVTIDGGAGVDTLDITAALATELGALTAANYAKKGIVNFEKLAINTSMASGSVIDTERLGLNNDITLKGATTVVTTAATLNNVANGGTVTLAAVNTGNLTIAVKDAAVAGSSSDVLNIVLAGEHTTAGIAYATLTAANVETININSTTGKETPIVTANTNTVATLTTVGAEAINISGDVKFILTNGLANTYTALKTIDASANTAGVDIKATSVAQGITITGTAAADAITGGAGNDLITAGAGNDVVTASNGVDVISLGAGNNTFVLAAAGNSGVTIATADRITDFSAGTNVINLDAFLTTSTDVTLIAQSSVQLAVNNLITAGTTTFDGILAALGAANGVVDDGKAGTFQFDGNTYVFGNATDGISASADFVIRLDGLHTLTADNFILT